MKILFKIARFCKREFRVYGTYIWRNTLTVEIQKPLILCFKTSN